MDKRVIGIIVFICLVLINSYAGDHISRYLVKDLEDTAIFYDNPNISRKSFNNAAKENMDFFKDIRKKKILRLVSFFHINSINAILEWGGGLEKKYCIVIFSKDTIYWLTWIRENDAMGKIRVENKNLIYSLDNKLKKLSDYTGGSLKAASDRIILFITFYKENLPQKTFCSDYPDKKNEFENYLYNELACLIKMVKSIIRRDISFIMYLDER